MSPSAFGLTSKHRRVTRHVHFPSREDIIYVHHMRGEQSPPPMKVFDFFNKYWFLLIIAVAVIVVSLVAVIGIVMRLYGKRRKSATQPTPKDGDDKVSHEKDTNSDTQSTIAPLDEQPKLGTGNSSPDIIVTPATASPTKSTFPWDVENPFAYKSMDRNSNTRGPYLPGKSPVFRFPESEENSQNDKSGIVSPIEPDGSQVQEGEEDGDTSRDPSASSSRASDVKLDDVDFKSSVELSDPEVQNEEPVAANTSRYRPLSTLSTRIASFFGRGMSSTSDSEPDKEDVQEENSDDDHVSAWTAASTPNEELTEGELRTLAEQFPPASTTGELEMSKVSDDAVVGGGSALPDTSAPRFASPPFSFHYPTGHHMRHRDEVASPPASTPESRTELPTVERYISRLRRRSLSPPKLRNLDSCPKIPRSGSHNDLRHSTLKDEHPVDKKRNRARGGFYGVHNDRHSISKLRSVSDRYAAKNLAAGSPGSGTSEKDQEIVLERELQNYSNAPY